MSSVQSERRLVIIGDAFADICCYIPRWPREQGGDTELLRPVQSLPGGSAVNTATHIQQRKHKGGNTDTILLMTCFQLNDENGRVIENHLKAAGIPYQNCVPSDCTLGTGHCVVIVNQEDQHNERSFFTYEGCLRDFKLSDCGDLGDFQRVHIAGFYNLPGFRDLSSFYGKEVSMVPQHDATGDWKVLDSSILQYVKYLILNELEANRLSESHGHEIGDFVHGLSLLSPSTTFVVTRGERGAIAFQDHVVICSVDQAAKVNVVDPTGAGDAFTAGFLSAASVEEGIRLGCAMGTACVTQHGASTRIDASLVTSILEDQGPLMK